MKKESICFMILCITLASCSGFNAGVNVGKLNRESRTNQSCAAAIKTSNPQALFVKLSENGFFDVYEGSRCDVVLYGSKIDLNEVKRIAENRNKDEIAFLNTIIKNRHPFYYLKLYNNKKSLISVALQYSYNETTVNYILDKNVPEYILKNRKTYTGFDTNFKAIKDWNENTKSEKEFFGWVGLFASKYDSEFSLRVKKLGISFERAQIWSNYSEKIQKTTKLIKIIKDWEEEKLSDSELNTWLSLFNSFDPEFSYKLFNEKITSENAKIWENFAIKFEIEAERADDFMNYIMRWHEREISSSELEEWLDLVDSRNNMPFKLDELESLRKNNVEIENVIFWKKHLNEEEILVDQSTIALIINWNKKEKNVELVERWVKLYNLDFTSKLIDMGLSIEEAEFWSRETNNEFISTEDDLINLVKASMNKKLSEKEKEELILMAMLAQEIHLEEQRKKNEEARLARIKAEEKALKEFNAQFPYYAILECRYGEDVYDIRVCLSGRSDTTVELEVTVDGKFISQEKKHYQLNELYGVDFFRNGGLKIDLSKSFFIRAQNSHDTLSILLRVFDRNDNLLAEKEAGRRFAIAAIRN